LGEEGNAMTKEAVTVQPSETQAGPVAAQPAIGEDRIRIRAYELYQKRGEETGDAEGDWYRAEAELRAEGAEAK
jgi:hypothetical protein